MKKIVISFLIWIMALQYAFSAEGRLLRFADVYKDKVAFVYAGDIWVANINTGTSIRLTSHKGLELFPKFSPDGKYIAFSGEYSGTRQVYVIPVDGGTPKQLTFYNDVGPMPPRGGYDYQVLDWTPDGKYVVFRANRLPWGRRMGKYFKVPVDGGLEEALPIPEGGTGMLSPDGKKFVYTPIAREFRTWKRYRGGRAQDVWIFDLEKIKAEQITHYKGTDNLPVWVKDKIYFTSDRTGILNLYEYNLTTKKITQVTFHTDYDVLWPSAGPDKVVYECGGYLYLFDPATKKSRKLSIEIHGDFLYTQPIFKNVKNYIHAMDISPTGKRAVFSARGDVFTVPAKYGEIRNITNTQGIREINATWSPDGKWIAYLSDKTGEYEIYIRPQDGKGKEKQITRNGSIWKFSPVWSPDSKKLAFADKNQTLYYVDITTGKMTMIDRGKYNDIRYYTWSPGSKWIAYTKQMENQMSAIWLYSLEKNQTYQLTSEYVSNYNPVFDPKGRYLYFLSDRDYHLTFSDWEFNYVYTKPTRIYLAPLRENIPVPFQPRSDEEGKEYKNPVEKASNPEDLIDVRGFDKRTIALPLPSNHYRGLQANENGVLFLKEKDDSYQLSFYDIVNEKETEILSRVSRFVLSFNGKKVLYSSNGKFGIIDATRNAEKDRGTLDLSNLIMKIDPKKEWKQIFVDAWRLIRDWFYDPNMHGVDWYKMRKKYEPLVDYVAHRADLDYILGELGGELSSGHVYVNSGDYPKVERHDNGLLGCEVAPDKSGYYKIIKIFPGENWHENFRSPLTEPGLNVKVGDFILAIDGNVVKTTENFYKYLENKGGHVVTLLINDRPSMQGAREIKVKTITSETSLRYLDWVLSRQRLVEKLSHGRIGYIHIPNTAVEGNRELFKHFYPQTKKEALIIDDRYNGGGFIPDRMIELLDRPLLNYWVRRGVKPSRTPGFTHIGPKVCLINGYSSSGGDAFPYYFRKRGLGKLIGTRTWGGLIGLSGNPGFSDNGSISIPTFRILDEEGHWIIENEGVSPDIEVVDRPDLVAKGQDPTLEKAVEVLLEELKKHPVKKITVPPAPNESLENFKAKFK